MDDRPAFARGLMVVLIDHQRARFFEPRDSGKGLEERGHVEPKDPHGFRRHLDHRKEADYIGQRVPELDDYYDQISERLRNATAIVLIGDAISTSGALVYFRAYLKEKHKDLDHRVAGAERADLKHITLGQVEQIAKRYV